MNRIVGIILGCCWGLLAHAQTDTSFWFAAPEVTYNNGSSHSDRPIYMHLTSLNQPSTVTISQPANSSFTPIVVSLSPNTSSTINLTAFIDSIETKPPNQAQNFGIHVRATNFITAYYEEASLDNPELFVLKGRNALGTNFMIPTQNLMNNDKSKKPSAYSSFDIIATEDSTVITITPADNIVGHLSGTTFSIVLNKGQTYSCAAVSNLAANHLMGSIVSSNKPIAITVKDDSIGGGGYYGCLDLAGDQIVPLSVLGTKYISIPGYLNNAPVLPIPTDWVFILATQNNTIVKINDTVEAVLNAGQTYRQGSYNKTFYIEGSNPIYVLHLSGFGCEVGQTLLPSIECTGSRNVAFNRPLKDPLYMNILVPKGGESSFTFNGNTNLITASQFDTVPFTNGLWKYAQILVSTTDLPVGGAAIITNSGYDFHLGMIHGNSRNGCRYGYFSDFNKFSNKVSSSATNNSACVGDSIQLFSDVGATSNVSFQWSGPNGFSSTLKNPVLSNIALSDTGMYICIATKAGCSVGTDSVKLEISIPPKTKIKSNNPVCEGDDLHLSSEVVLPEVSYQWVGPKSFSSTNTSVTIPTVKQENAGNYILTGTIQGCTRADTAQIIVSKAPIASITTLDTVYCMGQSIFLKAANTVNGTIFSWINSHNQSTTYLGQFDTIAHCQLSDSGIYTLTTSLGSCISSSSIHIVVSDTPNTIPFSNSPLCEKQTLQFGSNPTNTAVSYAWSGPNGFSSNNQFNQIALAKIAYSGNYILKQSIHQCIKIDTIYINISPMPNALIFCPDTVPCSRKTLNLSNINPLPNTSFLWTGPKQFQSTSPNIVLNDFSKKDTGRYILHTSIGACINTDSIYISIRKSPSVVFNTIHPICLNDSNIQLIAFDTTSIAGKGVFTGKGVLYNGLFSPIKAGEGTSNIQYSFQADNGCFDTKSQPIVVLPAPTIVTQHQKTLFIGKSTILNTTINGSYDSLIWSPSTSLDNPMTVSPTANPVVNTTYTIKVVNHQGCVTEDSVFVKLMATLMIPNAFSPNNDHVNDSWEIKSLLPVQNIQAQVFDRNGQVVFSSISFPIVWDGNYNLKPVPDGTYYYKITVDDAGNHQVLTGWVLVIR